MSTNCQHLPQNIHYRMDYEYAIYHFVTITRHIYIIIIYTINKTGVSVDMSTIVNIAEIFINQIL